MCYPKCNDGFEGALGPICSSMCPSGTKVCGIDDEGILCLGPDESCDDTRKDITEQIIKVAVNGSAAFTGIGAVFAVKDIITLTE
jgi:hypothetical protein